MLLAWRLRSLRADGSQSTRKLLSSRRRDDPTSINGECNPQASHSFAAQRLIRINRRRWPGPGNQAARKDTNNGASVVIPSTTGSEG